MINLEVYKNLDIEKLRYFKSVAEGLLDLSSGNWSSEDKTTEIQEDINEIDKLIESKECGN